MTFSLPKACSQAGSLCLLADNAYDSDDLRNALVAQGASAVIPSKTSRAQKLPFDEELYKARSEIECTINLLKKARRFATWYEKTLRNYAAGNRTRVRAAVAKNLTAYLRGSAPI